MISVVICSKDGNRNIKRPLNSLNEQICGDLIFEVILIDDGSIIPLTNEINIENYSFNIMIHSNEENKGLGYSRNKGIELSNGEIICFTDDDVLIDKFWIRNINLFFKKNPDVDVMGGEILPLELNECSDIYTHYSRNPTFNHIKESNESPIFSYLKRSLMIGDNRLRNGDLLKSTMGVNSAYRRRVLEDVKVNDNLYRGVDLDLNLRLRNKGHLQEFNSKAIIYHPHRKGLKKFLSHMNEYIYAQSNLVESELDESHHQNMIKIIPYPIPLLLFILTVILIPLSLLNNLINSSVINTVITISFSIQILIFIIWYIVLNIIHLLSYDDNKNIKYLKCLIFYDILREFNQFYTVLKIYIFKSKT